MILCKAEEAGCPLGTMAALKYTHAPGEGTGVRAAHAFLLEGPSLFTLAHCAVRGTETGTRYVLTTRESRGCSEVGNGLSAFSSQQNYWQAPKGELSVTCKERTFVGKVMSLLFNILSRFVIAFAPRSKRLLISSLQSLSTVILEPKKIKSAMVSIFSPSICPEVMGPDATAQGLL